ncbi:hypothetical protein T02_7324 [Trichinella nativa]|uniref:Uncharacterized protein n=1 Tax=Trichinella nativa TaxID=6335 RepID=A0A0V1L814_9BILA|nr:hypothetical protein T02_7324 [Trichinella nativa]
MNKFYRKEKLRYGKHESELKTKSICGSLRALIPIQKRVLSFIEINTSFSHLFKLHFKNKAAHNNVWYMNAQTRNKPQYVAIHGRNKKNGMNTTD